MRRGRRRKKKLPDIDPAASQVLPPIPLQGLCQRKRRRVQRAMGTSSGSYGQEAERQGDSLREHAWLFAELIPRKATDFSAPTPRPSIFSAD